MCVVVIIIILHLIFSSLSSMWEAQSHCSSLVLLFRQENRSSPHTVTLNYCLQPELLFMLLEVLSNTEITIQKWNHYSWGLNYYQGRLKILFILVNDLPPAVSMPFPLFFSNDATANPLLATNPDPGGKPSLLQNPQSIKSISINKAWNHWFQHLSPVKV